MKELTALIKRYLGIVNNFAGQQAERRARMNLYQKVTTALLQRVKINVEALAPLLKLYAKSDAYFTPIALILRSITSDFLTFCYFTTFYTEDDNFETLENEINLHDRDFLRSILEVTDAEKTIHKHEPFSDYLYRNEREQLRRIDQLTRRFRYLIDSRVRGKKIKPKSTKEIRLTSNDDLFFTKSERENPKIAITEKYKFDRMARFAFKKYVLAYIAFKYFSQFQHFSTQADELNQNANLGRNEYFLTVGIDLVLVMTTICVSVIDPDDKKTIESLNKLYV